MMPCNQRIFLSLLLLLAFDASLCICGIVLPPTRLSHRLSQPLLAETNAMRLARGLHPLPPARRGTGTDTARRATTSSDKQQFNGIIRVLNGSDPFRSLRIGVLQLTDAQDRYIVGPEATAEQFSSYGPFYRGIISHFLNFMDSGAPSSHPNLAGLISPGVDLLATNTNAAIIGSAVETNPNYTPQNEGSVSIPGREYLTSIWDYTPSMTSGVVTATWVNHDGSHPSVSIVWDPVGQTLYITANPDGFIHDHPGAVVVTFEIPRYIGTG